VYFKVPYFLVSWLIQRFGFSEKGRDRRGLESNPLDKYEKLPCSRMKNCQGTQTEKWTNFHTGFHSNQKRNAIFYVVRFLQGPVPRCPGSCIN